MKVDFNISMTKQAVMFWIALGLGAVSSWLVAEIYKRYLTPDEKNRFENWVKTHHGEAGFIGVLLGLLIKSPTTTGAGIGLMIHDRKDMPKWFTGNKLNRISYSPQTMNGWA